MSVNSDLPLISALQAKFYINKGLSSCENCIGEGIYNSEDENGQVHRNRLKTAIGCNSDELLGLTRMVSEAILSRVLTVHI